MWLVVAAIVGAEAARLEIQRRRVEYTMFINSRTGYKPCKYEYFLADNRAQLLVKENTKNKELEKQQEEEEAERLFRINNPPPTPPQAIWKTILGNILIKVFKL